MKSSSLRGLAFQAAEQILAAKHAGRIDGGWLAGGSGGAGV